MFPNPTIYPNWLITTYHIIGSVSIVLNALGIYVLMFQNDKMGSFRYYMLGFLVSCASMDFFVTCLMQPVCLCPIFGGYSVGILTTWLFIPVHYQFIVFIILTILEYETLIVCFAEKCQTIRRILEKPALPVWAQRLGYVAGAAIIVIISLCLHSQDTSEEKELKYLEKTYPEYLSDIKQLRNFVIYTDESQTFLMIVIILIIGLTFCSLFLAFMIDIFRQMSELKARLSASTYQKHEEAVKSLLVQLATSTLCLAPPTVILALLLAGFEYQKTAAEVLLCVFVTHSSVNFICLTIFFPPYHRFFRKVFRKILGKKDNRKVMGSLSNNLF